MTAFLYHGMGAISVVCGPDEPSPLLWNNAHRKERGGRGGRGRRGQERRVCVGVCDVRGGVGKDVWSKHVCRGVHTHPPYTQMSVCVVVDDPGWGREGHHPVKEREAGESVT